MQACAATNLVLSARGDGGKFVSFLRRGARATARIARTIHGLQQPLRSMVGATLAVALVIALAVALVGWAHRIRYQAV